MKCDPPVEKHVAHRNFMTVYGRQETFEHSPPGWPQFWRNTGEQWRINGRPTPQWEQLAAGRSDDLGVSGS